MFKKFGSKWSIIYQQFENRTENQIKNRFYSILRRVFTKKRRENPAFNLSVPKGKDGLLEYFDYAMEHEHHCCSKRGRIKKDNKKAIVKDASSVKLGKKKALDDVVFAPFANLRLIVGELAPSVPATKEQLELAKQLLKPSQSHNLLEIADSFIKTCLVKMKKMGVSKKLNADHVVPQPNWLHS